MQATVNGQQKEIDSGTNVTALLGLYELEPIRVAVEINEDLVPRSSFSTTTIFEGDRIEIVTFVGGG